MAKIAITGVEHFLGADGNEYVFYPEITNAFDVVLVSSNWDDSQGRPVQIITVSGVTGASNQIIDRAISSTDNEREAYAKANLFINSQSNNSLTFVCDGEKPTIDIPITILIIGA